MSSGAELSPSSASSCLSSSANLPNQVPKYGTVIPNRVFVGGIATNTTDQELKVFFSSFGAVKDTKIICDRAGVSKGYGFVTFETQEDAEKIIKKESENLVFKERKLNIGPAVRKQQAFTRMDGLPGSAPAMLISPNLFGYSNSAAAGLAVMPGQADVNCYQAIQQQAQAQTAPNYSNVLVSPTVYVTQPQYQCPSTPLHTQAAAQAVQYANQPWLSPASARYLQPSPAATVAPAQGTTYILPWHQDYLYATPPGAAHTQVLDLSDGNMLEQNPAADADAKQVSCASSLAKETISHTEASHNITNVIPMNSRTLQQPPNLHSCHYANSNAIAQPPPFKKMAPMPSHHPHMTSAPPPLQISQRGYGTQVVLKAGPVPAAKSSIMPPNVCAAQRIPNLTMSYIAPNPKVDEMRVKFEHDGQLAASIAPPTPPATPAPTSSN